MAEIFISYASVDRGLAARIAEGAQFAGHNVFLDSDRDNGIAPGTAWQRRLLRELRICDAVVFLNSPAGQASMWCHSELVIATNLDKRVYPFDLTPDVASHPLLRSLQGIRFDPDISVSIRRLTDTLEDAGLAGQIRPRWRPGRSPYPGLAAMDISDAGVFFGRDEEVKDLVARVDSPLARRDGDLVVVMGPSGAGKSSLVNAGLAARLRTPQSGWVVADPFEPGLRPLDRLVGRLAALAPGRLDDEQCQARLMNDGLAALGEWLILHSEGSAKRLLITVDQAEQLATVTPPAECADFLKVLSSGLKPDAPVTVVITVRSDRFDEIQRLPEIGAMIHEPFVIAPMDRSRLRRVIERPAWCADLSFAPGLVGRLVDDAARSSSGETADALPFLAVVLREMYDLLEKETRNEFTEADYDRAGGIDGAIIQRTKAAEAALPPGSDLVLDRMLPRFVALEEERLPAARPVPSGQLTPAEQAIAASLEDQRLLVGTADALRLAHEQLITAWPRLAKAIAEHRDDIVVQARLERQAADWKHGHGALLGHDATVSARDWLSREAAEPAESHALISEFVRESGEALGRRRAGAIGLICLIAVLVLVALVIAAGAVIERSSAVRQSRLAQSDEMAAEAINLLPANGSLAMLVSLQAYERAPTLQAESALIEAAQQPLVDLLESGQQVNDVAFSPDGRTVAAGSKNKHIDVWDTATGRMTASLSEGSAVYGVAFSPGGQTLAAGDSGGDIGLWNVPTGFRVATLPEGSLAYSVAFSPDGRLLAAGDFSGHVKLWNPLTGRRTATLGVGGQIFTVAFSPDGRTLAVGGADGRVGLWDVATRRRIGSLNELSLVYSVAFSPDGRTLAVGDAGGHVGIWNLATGRETATLDEGIPVFGVAFGPDGHLLAVGDYGTQVSLWNLATRRRIAMLDEGSLVFSVAFSPDGRTLAVGDNSGFAGLWDVATRHKIGSLDEGSLAYSVAFSPDGRTLAVGDNSGYAGLWDVAAERRTANLNEGSLAYSVAFSPNGQILATADGLGDVGIWNVATGRELARVAENDGAAELAFSPDGQLLAIGSLDGNIVLLQQNLTDLTPGRFRQIICGKVRHNMTAAQWAEYAPGQPYRQTCS